MPNPTLAVGKRAPAFTLPDAHGARTRLTELRGKWVVMCFLLKAKSVTCRKQVVDLCESYPDFRALGAEVLAICPDPPHKVREFSLEQGIPFSLLIDRDAKLASRYGAFRERNGGGRRYAGIVRATFLIDPSGKVCHIWDNLRVKGHVHRVLDRLDKELQDLA